MVKISGTNGSIFGPFLYVGFQKHRGVFYQFASDIFNNLQQRNFSSTSKSFTLRLHLEDEEDTGFPKGYNPTVNNLGTDALKVIKQNKELIVQVEQDKSLVPVGKRKELVVYTKKNEELGKDSKK